MAEFNVLGVFNRRLSHHTGRRPPPPPRSKPAHRRTEGRWGGAAGSTRPQNGPRLSEQHLPPINKERWWNGERNWIGKGDGSARACCLIIEGVICLKTDRQSGLDLDLDRDDGGVASDPSESMSVNALIGRSLARSLAESNLLHARSARNADD